MKNNNNFQIIRLADLIKYLSVFLSFFLLSGCEDDEVADDRNPTIQVEGVTEGELEEVEYNSEGFPLNLIIADNVALESYSVEIDSSSINVYSMEEKDLNFKLEHETVVIRDLGMNYVYDVKLTVRDVNSNSTSFQFQLRVNDFQKYEYLGLVGDATMAGWNPGASEAMIKDPNDPAIFTYEGPLSAAGEGAMKIATYLGGWCDGDWLFASEANKPISQPDNFVINDCGGPDNKWKVTEETEGDYLVTVNLRDKTIVFQKK